MALNYTLYHLHSDYSLLDSCTDFQEYADLVKESGGTAIASTEHGMPRGWVSKKLYCDKIGLKFLHGVEIYLTEDPQAKVRDNYHTVLIAKNLAGVYELNSLVSLSTNRDHMYYTNRISFAEFLQISDNIIKTSACLASPLNKLDESNPWFFKLLKHYDYLEVQPHNHPDQIAFNKRLAQYSKEYGIPLIAGTDTHSSSPYKAECRDILLSFKDQHYGDEDAFDLTYKTYDELVQMFERQGALTADEYTAAIDSTNKMADSCESFELDKGIKYPILNGSPEKDEEIFSKRCWESLDEKIRSGIIPPEQEHAFRDAITEELRVFKKLKMSGFMLSMSDLVRWCKSQVMAIGTARGSVGGSRAAYVTDIIDLNPETWHTVFSRFANEDRVEIGDIDVDVVYDDRPQIFQYIIGRFGVQKTARVASYGTLANKAIVDGVCRALFKKTKDEKYSIPGAKKIKKEMESNPDKARAAYPEVFRYYDGLAKTKVSQSVHPAGMVISPITLDDHYGVFLKDGEMCLMLDMDEAHEVGLAKYDFLALKTVKVIRDVCHYIGREYPKTSEIDWNDEAVWDDIDQNQSTIFQFEGAYAADCLRKFKPRSIFDMSLVTACIRPSGASYRDDLLARKPHHNPSKIIDEMLESNVGYLVYQEDTIKFLQQICGLTGSEADNIRRAIGRKQKDRLDAALPSILAGYCSKSTQPREQAEQEAKEFLQIIEDSASYQFGYNHSIAYCLLGYLCAYYRHYYPLEYVTSFLNNAANDDDIQNGTELAKKLGIKVTLPKWGLSHSDYYFTKEKNVIAKGLNSIKYMSAKLADEMSALYSNTYDHFVDLLAALDAYTSMDTRQLDILIKLDFFSDFGNQRELLRITEFFYGMFKCGEAKQIKKADIDGTQLEHIVKRYAVGVTKSGGEAKSYTLLDVWSILREVEDLIKASGMSDLSDIVKVQNFKDIMGYVGYTSGREEDRRKLYVTGTKPLMRKKDGKQFGYSIYTKSIGTGKEARFTIFNERYNRDPIYEGNIVYCKNFTRDGVYFRLLDYEKVV